MFRHSSIVNTSVEPNEPRSYTFNNYCNVCKYWSDMRNIASMTPIGPCQICALL